MKKILITGGTGFIGSNLVPRLLEDENNELVIADNGSRNASAADVAKLTQHPRVTLLQIDLSDPSSYAKLGEGYAEIYHLASVNGTRLFYEKPHEVLRINTLTMIYLLEWMIKHAPEAKLLFTSSNEAYAGALEAFNALPLPTPENVPLIVADPYNPRWSYGGAKISNEQFLIHYANHYKLRAVIVRPHNFYGPGDAKDHVVPDLIARIKSRVDPFPLFGADNTRDFTYIDDAVEAMVMLMESSKTDALPIETVHVGNGNEVTMGELAETLFTIAQWHPEKIDVKPAPAGSVKRRLADISKIQKMIGWKAHTSFTDGLQRTYEWHIERL